MSNLVKEDFKEETYEGKTRLRARCRIKLTTEFEPTLPTPNGVAQRAAGGLTTINGKEKAITVKMFETFFNQIEAGVDSKGRKLEPMVVGQSYNSNAEITENNMLYFTMTPYSGSGTSAEEFGFTYESIAGEVQEGDEIAGLVKATKVEATV